MRLFQNSIIEYRFVVVRSFVHSSRFLSRETIGAFYLFFFFINPKIQRFEIIRRVLQRRNKEYLQIGLCSLRYIGTIRLISCRLLNSSLAVRSKSNRICETLSSRSFPFLRMANEIQATLKGLLITFFAGTSNLLSTFLLSNYTRIIQGTILIEKKKKKRSERVGNSRREERE